MIHPVKEDAFNDSNGWKRVASSLTYTTTNASIKPSDNVYRTFTMSMENALGAQRQINVGIIEYAIDSNYAVASSENHGIFVGTGKRGIMLTPEFGLRGQFDESPPAAGETYSELVAKFNWNWTTDGSTLAADYEYSRYKQLFNAITGDAGSSWI